MKNSNGTSIFWILVIMLLFMSCHNKDRKIKNDLINLQQAPICIPINKMDCIFNKCKESTLLVNENNDNLKLIIYADSIVCSSCRIKTMYKWDAFLSKLKKFPNKVKVFFIFAPSHDKINQFKITARTLPRNYPIYTDTANVFLRLNPHIPEDPTLHTFLLDENNKVILVGNPLENKRIEEMFWRIVKEKLGEPKDSVGQ